MPRQPYPLNYPKPIYGIAHPERMTKMAEAVGRCIMLFSYVDWQMALVLAAIMKAESEASIAIFLSLRNARAQRDVLIAASEMTLFDKNKGAFDATLTLYGSLQAQRADIAHGIFGLAPEIEHEAAWIQTKDLSKHWLDVFHRPGNLLSDLGLKRDEKEQREQEQLMQRSSVYKVADLDQLERDIKGLWEASFHFYVHLRYGPTQSDSEAFQKLCSVPQIAQELARMRDQKNNPRPAG
jgi:hypothetical protein